MYYCYAAGGTHAVTPLRFYPEGQPDAGQIWHGQIHIFEDSAMPPRVKEDISDSFALVPLDWKDKWVTLADCPRATNLYTTINDVPPSQIAQFLLDARNHRQSLAVAAGVARPDPHPPMFGAPPRNLQPPSVNEVSDANPVDEAIAFDPADADHDGVVSRQERKRHDKGK